LLLPPPGGRRLVLQRDVGDLWGPAKGAEPGPGAGIELANGRLLVASHQGAYQWDYITYSDDGGATFATISQRFQHMDEVRRGMDIFGSAAPRGVRIATNADASNFGLGCPVARLLLKIDRRIAVKILRLPPFASLPSPLPPSLPPFPSQNTLHSFHPRSCMYVYQATLADLGNGSVLLNMRHQAEDTLGRGISRSHDYGLTWTNVSYE